MDHETKKTTMGGGENDWQTTLCKRKIDEGVYYYVGIIISLYC